ncbi:MAG: hypothetical protein OXN93_06340, partial [bacterium]|nr:hypothetical protein [bacterium]
EVGNFSDREWGISMIANNYTFAVVMAEPSRFPGDVGVPPLSWSRSLNWRCDRPLKEVFMPYRYSSEFLAGCWIV